MNNGNKELQRHLGLICDCFIGFPTGFSSGEGLAWQGIALRTMEIEDQKGLSKFWKIF